ncbi:MAG: lipid II flippase MurJ [Chloroflexota bacterium]
MKRADLLSVTAYTSVLRLIGQLFAFASGLTISATFGATDATDNYYTALILPASLANLVVNILTNLFAPIYLEHIHHDPAQQRSILSSLSFVTITALAGATLISIAAVPISTTLRSLQAPNALQASIFGVALVTLTPLVGLTRLLSAICEAHQRYKLPTAASLLNPLIFVLVLLLTAQRIGIYSLICANLAGQVTELVILLAYASRNLHISLRPSLRLHPAIREMLAQSLAPVVTYGALFFIPTFDRATAAALDAGSLTTFHYGERIVTVLDLIVMGSIITVVSNYWAQQSAERGIDATSDTFNPVISNLLFILVPLSLGGFALRYPIFSVLFHHGLFIADGASAQVFGLLLLSAPLNYMIVIIVRLLLIARDVRAQMILAIGISALNTILNILLAPLLGLSGIALSTLLSRVFILVLGYRFLRNRFSQIDIKPIQPNLVHTFCCAGIMVITLALLQSLLSPALSRSDGLLVQIAALGITISAGIGVYFGIASLTHHPEFTSLRQTVTDRLSTSIRSSQA